MAAGPGSAQTPHVCSLQNRQKWDCRPVCLSPQRLVAPPSRSSPAFAAILSAFVNVSLRESSPRGAFVRRCDPPAARSSCPRWNQVQECVAERGEKPQRPEKTGLCSSPPIVVPVIRTSWKPPPCVNQTGFCCRSEAAPGAHPVQTLGGRAHLQMLVSVNDSLNE